MTEQRILRIVINDLEYFSKLNAELLLTHVAKKLNMSIGLAIIGIQLYPDLLHQMHSDYIATLDCLGVSLIFDTINGNDIRLTSAAWCIAETGGG